MYNIASASIFTVKRIECVRSGHVGGVNNEKYLHENEIYFPKEHRFIVLLLQHGRCEHTLYLLRGEEHFGLHHGIPSIFIVNIYFMFVIILFASLLVCLCKSITVFFKKWQCKCSIPEEI